MKKIFAILSLAVLVQIACGSSSTLNATQTALSNIVTAASWTSTPNFTGKLFPNGANLYSGPGESYPQIGSVLGTVTITGQAYGCSWFQIVSPTNNGAGWIRANQIIYTVNCADVPGVQIPTLQPTATLTLITSITFTLIPTETFTLIKVAKPVAPLPVVNKCNVESAMTIGNRTGATATFTLVGPGTFYVTLPPDKNTLVPVCEGCYDIYITGGGCGDASGTHIGRICDGFNGWLQCK